MCDGFSGYISPSEGKPGPAVTIMRQIQQGCVRGQQLKKIDDLPQKCPNFLLTLRLLAAETQSGAHSQGGPCSRQKCRKNSFLLCLCMLVDVRPPGKYGTSLTAPG